jgi:fatty-acyl-CoA synthase
MGYRGAGMAPERRPEANVGAWLDAHAAERPEALAVLDAASGERITYAQLAAAAERAAAALADAGVQRGDRVAVALPSEPLYLALYFAVSQLGAVLLPLNTRLAAPELAFQLADSAPRVVVHGADPALELPAGSQSLAPDALRRARPGAARPPLAPGGEAPHLLMYTSGTTGTPRGALLPHRKTLHNALNAERSFGLRPDDRVAVPVPLFHSFGLLILSVPTMLAGAAVVLIPRFDARAVQHTVAATGATLLGGVPVMFQRMVRAGLDRAALARLRFAFSAGAALDRATVAAFAAAGVSLRQGYGQTETSLLCCLEDPDTLRKAGSVGRPLLHADVRVVDERGEPLPAGSAGEVVVRGPVRMLGYWRGAGAPPEPAPELAGWHRTGDLGCFDAEGFLNLVGRVKEMYISGGENVYPAEVEHVLEQHPNVAEAAVVGIAHPEWGETGRAYLVPIQRPLDADALHEWCRARLAGYKCPRELVVVDELPRTASGKVQKHRLRELDAGARGAAAPRVRA